MPYNKLPVLFLYFLLHLIPINPNKEKVAIFNLEACVEDIQQFTKIDTIIQTNGYILPNDCRNNFIPLLQYCNPTVWSISYSGLVCSGIALLLLLFTLSVLGVWLARRTKSFSLKQTVSLWTALLLVFAAVLFIFPHSIDLTGNSITEIDFSFSSSLPYMGFSSWLPFSLRWAVGAALSIWTVGSYLLARWVWRSNSAESPEDSP